MDPLPASRRNSGSNTMPAADRGPALLALTIHKLLGGGPASRTSIICCWMPGPPPALVSTRGTDVAHYLPQPVHERGLSIRVTVSPSGRAVAVEDEWDLCLTIGPEGEIVPKHVLTHEEERCLLDAFRDWRFAGVESCWQVVANVRVGATAGGEVETAEECRRGPTNSE